jgi:quinol monooxygenase YgiN
MASDAGSVRLSGFLRCTDMREVETVRRYLPEHLRLTRAEPGCIAFDVSPTENPLVRRVEERFADRAAFEAHRRRTRASTWWAATKCIARDVDMS